MKLFKEVLTCRKKMNSLIIENNFSKTLHSVIVIFLSFYIAIIAFALALPYIHPSGESLFEIAILIVVFIIFAFVLYFLFFIFNMKILEIDFKHLVVNDSISTIRLKTKLVFFLIIFLPLFFNFLYKYPGGLSNDNIDQWAQIQAFEFDNWHPVFHTLTLWLFAQIINQYAFVVFVQITIFSASIVYLYSTMHAWGIPRKILFSLCALTAINANTQSIMLFLLKDSAMSIAVVFLTAMIINIYLSKGDWVSNWKNLLFFSVTLVFTTLLRHNAFFLTFPLLGLLTIFYFKKAKIKLILPIFAVFIILIRGPLYSALNVTYPDNTFQESVGVPMTIMSDVFTRHPDTFPEPGKSFMLEIATIDDWQKLYQSGNFNSIKFNSNTSTVLKNTEPKIFFKMVISAIRFDPAYSANAVLEVTSFVWKPYDIIEISHHFKEENNLNIFKNGTISSLGAILAIPINVLSSFLPPFLSSIGFSNLLLIFALAITFLRLGIRPTIFVLPIICYNFGTMLLLCGPDYRFFHFNILVAIPICLVLFSKFYSKNRDTEIKLESDG